MSLPAAVEIELRQTPGVVHVSGDAEHVYLLLNRARAAAGVVDRCKGIVSRAAGGGTAVTVSWFGMGPSAVGTLDDAMESAGHRLEWVVGSRGELVEIRGTADDAAAEEELRSHLRALSPDLERLLRLDRGDRTPERTGEPRHREHDDGGSG